MSDEISFDRDEMRRAVLGLAGVMTAKDDQARAMSDAELGENLLNGRWTTIEIHEAGRRLKDRAHNTGTERDG